MIGKIFSTALTAAIMTIASTSFAGWSVGNGGDNLRLAVKKAKMTASQMILKVRPDAIDQNTTGVKEWIIENQAQLAADVLASPHTWVHTEESTCAWTTTPNSQNAPQALEIEFSFPTCKKTLKSYKEAAALLIHESVHHFGITSEDFADDVALAITQAWTDGKLEWSSLTNNGTMDPEARFNHTAVLSGNEMIIFGGLLSAGRPYKNTNTIYSYNLAHKVWNKLSSRGAPKVHNHQAALIGNKMYIWGGYKVVSNGRLKWQNSGAAFDLENHTWQKLKMPFGPSATDDFVTGRAVQTLSVIDDKLLVFGGLDSDGEAIPAGIYHPNTGKWKKVSMDEAPLKKYGHVAVAADKKLIIFAGVNANRRKSNDGAIYDLHSDSWKPLHAPAAIKKVENAKAIWTGSKMLSFGGFESGGDLKGRGASFHVTGDKWKLLETETTTGRIGHSATWTGSEVLIFGGKSLRLKTFFNSVNYYSPENNSWVSKASKSAPSSRYLHTAVWTGTSLIVWGGLDKKGNPLADGGAYYP